MRVGRFYTEAGESELFYNEMFFLPRLALYERTNEPFVRRHGLTEIPPK